MLRLLIATKNPGKLVEISRFLSDLPVKTVSLKDIGIAKDVVETGKTYRENSVKKAKFYAKESGLPTIADDGGIEISGLHGEPGVRSRRYFGKHGKEATDSEIIEAMRKLIKRLPKDSLGATFKVVLTLAKPSGKTFSVDGKVRGILKDPRFKLFRGYPYRSFFFLPKINKYYHENELSEDEMKVYNHRYTAIQKLKPIIRKALDI
jgi:XTP/dITP diphosphohydrolase